MGLLEHKVQNIVVLDRREPELIFFGGFNVFLVENKLA
jgi:hypothetical protein